jgi:hypothetical protein
VFDHSLPFKARVAERTRAGDHGDAERTEVRDVISDLSDNLPG